MSSRRAAGLARVGTTRHWHAREDGSVQCDVCPRHCRLREGQRGLCFVRACCEGEVVLTTYGRSSGYCVDPIEKKPLNHFLPGTPVLSFGTAGCNLSCSFCQNWDISKSREIDVLCDESPPERVARAAHALGCRSVAFTYNDPVVFLEYAIDVARACHERDLRTVAVTAGYVRAQAREEFFSEIDAANVDLKSFDDGFYRRLCGARLQPVLDTLLYLHRETDVWLEVTTLLIPGENDSDQEIRAAADWLVEWLGADVPWHLTAFHPDYRMQGRAATAPATLAHARALARSSGLRHVYTGNLRDPVGGSTWCHACGRKLIGRDAYVIDEWNLDSQAACRFCGERCPGVFEAGHGHWGARRQPVRLSDCV